MALISVTSVLLFCILSFKFHFLLLQFRRKHTNPEFLNNLRKKQINRTNLFSAAISKMLQNLVNIATQILTKQHFWVQAAKHIGHSQLLGFRILRNKIKRKGKVFFKHWVSDKIYKGLGMSLTKSFLGTNETLNFLKFSPHFLLSITPVVSPAKSLFLVTGEYRLSSFRA